ncbi:ABC transporter ATP-binding protein [Arachidicoccus ginsenosidimutans]|uniref:ABC transporter ATP-binding protein n=1 Tax=Arachidicoccus sp. BS20 TaxID=1850526 RepID=UPI0007F0EAA9|nr:ATP-binding cassette domain-containing protein [Arachidicoccus sp. BS20]ANI90676.1 ABC transporter ATP-binding protein [Arachidicoccus sp. BS20]
MVDIKNLHFSYKKKKVYDSIGLTFQTGYVYGLLGKNGTGKSTLLRTVCGLLFPDKGSVNVLGFNPSERKPAFLQEVFMVPEEFYLPDVSIQKYVCCNAPFYPKFSQPEFENYLKEFEVPVDNTLQEMSYGQKKKVLIAFALACNTSLLLMDEPSNGLDILSKTQFRKVLAGAVNENKCIIISTHQVKDLETLIDFVTIVDEGKILFNHSMDEVSSKLAFKFSQDKNNVSSILYEEQTLSGSALVIPNYDDESTKVDLELLYKTVVTNPQAVRQIFNHSKIDL